MTVKRWRDKWVVDFIDHSGKRQRRVSPVQTRRGAEDHEAELKNASSISTPSSESSGEGRLNDFAKEWLTTYVAVNNKPSEVVNKESALRVHLLPFFENCRLRDISARDIERYKAAKLDQTSPQKKRPISAKSVNNHLAILRKMLATAVDWNLLDRLPRIKKLKVAPSKFDWLTQDESARFLDAIDKHYAQWRAIFWIALRAGLRRGEIFALQWDDVDLIARILTVRRSVYRGKLVAPKGGRERSIPMTGQLTQVIKAHRSATMLKSEFLFPKEAGSLSKHQDHIDRPLHGALKRAGLRRMRFHDLRHSFASQLVTRGRSLKEVQELLGHESITMTMRYAHLAPERMRDAVSVLDADKTETKTTPSVEQSESKNSAG
jgi:integrase